MSFRQQLASQLPYLRRYARALTGSQSLGDAAVRETLEALLEAPEEWDEKAPAKTELFKTFHRIWNSEMIAPLESRGRSGVIAQFPVKRRQSLLLATVEGFTFADVGVILGMSQDDVRQHVQAARSAIEDALSARVLIIEDESIIALHIKQIVESLGHETIAIVRTRAEAVAKARDERPDLYWPTSALPMVQVALMPLKTYWLNRRCLLSSLQPFPNACLPANVPSRPI